MAKRIKTKTYYGQELVPRPRRLALMNLFLHGIEPTIRLGDTIYEAPTSERFDVILTNPPFGTKGANQAPDREDFTDRDQQQAIELRAARPDRAQARRPRRRRPAGQLPVRRSGRRGVRDSHQGLRPAHRPAPAARHVHAVQPGREGQRRLLHQGLRDRDDVDLRLPLQRPRHHQERPPAHPPALRRVRRCYGPDPNGRSPRKPEQSKDGRWRSFHISEVKERDFKLDWFKWIKDESLEDADELPEPEELATDAIAELEGAVGELNAVLALFEKGQEAADIA